MGQAKVRKMNGTYWREPEENDKCIYIDPSLPFWTQLPNTPEIRKCLIAMDDNKVGAFSRKSTAYHESRMPSSVSLPVLAWSPPPLFQFISNRTGLVGRAGP